MGQCGKKPARAQVEFHFLFTLTLKAKGFQEFHPFHNFHMLRVGQVEVPGSWVPRMQQRLRAARSRRRWVGRNSEVVLAMRIVGCGSGAWPGLGPRTALTVSNVRNIESFILCL